VASAQVVAGLGVRVVQGWGIVGSAVLAGADALAEDNVEVVGQFSAIGTGNPDSRSDLSVRVDGSGALTARVQGSYEQADLWLLDGSAVLVQALDVPGLRTQFAPFAVTLRACGGDVTMVVTQQAGSGGGQTWGAVTRTLTARTTRTAAGNVSCGFKSYSSAQHMAALTVRRW
jgi:hypothetical protein